MSGKYGGSTLKCALCPKSLYLAEAVLFEKTYYHRDCFRCVNCGDKTSPNKCKLKALKDAKDEHDKKIVCNKCIQRLGLTGPAKVVWKPPAEKSGSAPSSGSSKFGGGGTKCHVCGKTAFSAEQLSYEKKIYHVNCFRCAETGCTKKFEKTDDCAGIFKDKLYCKKCWAKGSYASKQTATKHESKTTSKPAASGSGRWGGGGVPCEKCAKTCYQGEKVQYDKKIYHPKCFTCKNCTKKISSTSNAAKFEDKNVTPHVYSLYCTKCFANLNLTSKQTKVVWTKSTTTTTTAGTSSIYGGGGSKCLVCTKTVFNAEQVKVGPNFYHPGCAECFHCKKKHTTFLYYKAENRTVCSKCWTTERYNEKQRDTKNSAKTVSADEKKPEDKRFKKFGGGGTKCYKCSKTCYPAETQTFEKHYWHIKCFTCKECDKKFPNSKEIQYVKHKDGNIDVYCKKCFTLKGLNRAAATMQPHLQHTENVNSEENKDENENKPDPEVTPADPEATSADPEATSADPEATSADPEATSADPEATQENPEEQDVEREVLD